MHNDNEKYRWIRRYVFNNRHWSSVEPRSNRMLAQHKNNSGYFLVWFKVNRKNIAKTVHRLVANAFIPNKKNKPHVNHIDSNRTNNTMENLEWCTVGENLSHSWKHGNRISTEKHKEESAKNGKKGRLLSKDDVISLREDKKTMTYKELSLKYNIAIQTAHNIVHKRTYADI